MVDETERRMGRISQDDFDRLVEAAALRATELAKQQLYIEIGKSTLSKVRWLLYIGLGAAATWFAGLGLFNKGH